ncbi:hypothetical protein [Clostridium sp. BJN0013]|uniref:hypothetical protein n=1 Tax=Clostridium sp. BJN0013 TaxID=3236840 RepID=UPI0034C6400A
MKGAYACGQAIKTNFLLLKGEWWESIDKGFSLFQDIVGKFTSQTSVTLVDSLVKSYLLGIENVTAIKSFESKLENRTYSFTATVITPFGNVTVAKTF